MYRFVFTGQYCLKCIFRYSFMNPFFLKNICICVLVVFCLTGHLCSSIGALLDACKKRDYVADQQVEL